jgi:hypothetical protein
MSSPYFAICVPARASAKLQVDQQTTTSRLARDIRVGIGIGSRWEILLARLSLVHLVSAVRLIAVLLAALLLLVLINLLHVVH